MGIFDDYYNRVKQEFSESYSTWQTYGSSTFRDSKRPGLKETEIWNAIGKAQNDCVRTFGSGYMDTKSKRIAYMSLAPRNKEKVLNYLRDRYEWHIDHPNDGSLVVE